MKKFMIAAAIVCAAAFAQAATVTWGSATLMAAANAEGGFHASTKVGQNNAIGQLYLLTESQYTDFFNAYTDNHNMSAVWAAKDTLTPSGDPAKSNRSNAISLTSTADAGKTVYAAVIYTYTDKTLEKDFYIANIGKATVSADGLDTSVGSLGTYFLGDEKGTATGGWVAIPEPTSGLLLLLGVAGLAHRRRRA